MLCVVALVAAGTAWWMLRPQQKDTLEHLAQPQSSSSTLNRDKAPTPKPQKSQEHQKAAGDSPAAKASRAIATMSLDERAGQLIMAPMFAGGNPADLSALISTRHVGSVVLIGNWNNGTAAAKTAADALQSYAPSGNQLIVSTDQEGGQVQHLKGSGFDTMPSAVAQGQMSADTLRSSAKTWGGQLKQAGINVDLAPVLGTVQVKRSSNAPIGALNRDFGLDSNGNAQHGIAFVEGMRDAGVGATVKHYPGLGAVTGNTDFTTEGILDTTTTLDDEEIGAFNTTIKQAKPAMVMMSLATYQRIDSSAPAAFSSKIIDGTLRGSVGYDGLIVANEPVADVLTVTIRKEATAAATYKRGTVLALSAGTAGDGKLVILGSTATTNETLTANCILAEDVEVGTTADVTALAYRTGHFARNKLAVASGYTLKATDEEELRKAGILLSDAIEY